MELSVYKLTDGFCGLIFVEERGVEPLLIADRDPRNFPQRIFLVRYVIGEGGGGENKRPVFKDELAGYDYEMKVTYPNQKVHLDELQSTLELSMYGLSEGRLSRVTIENLSTKEQRPIKAIVSETLVAKLIGLYRFAW